MTDLLRDPKPAIGLDRPPVDVRAAIVALAGGVATQQQQIRAWRFIIFELCGLISVPMALPAEESVQNWRAGCRYVGAYLEAARALPVDDQPPPEPPARTMTESVRRRQRPTA